MLAYSPSFAGPASGDHSSGDLQQQVFSVSVTELCSAPTAELPSQPTSKGASGLRRPAWGGSGVT